MKKSIPILIIIKGGAYGSFKSRGYKVGVKEWKRAIIEASQHAPKVKGPCKLELHFTLPPDRYPKDHPYGSDVDNLASAVMDALNDTVFSDVPGKDGAVVWLEVIKLKGETSDDAKLWIMIESLPAKVVTKKGADEYYLGPLYRAQVKKK